MEYDQLSKVWTVTIFTMRVAAVLSFFAASWGLIDTLILIYGTGG